jgi:hypothetical protein
MHVVSAPVLEGWTCLSDEQIVVRVVAGQTALFEVLMRRHMSACTGRLGRSSRTRARPKTSCNRPT